MDHWWRNAVVYQVYLRSFADGDGDGTGDLAGLRDRLPYLASLGVDALWVNPWYESPLRDGGYDVADYRRIDPRYGTVADAEALVAEAHDLGIKVLADLVPNHTSSEHRWFREAVASPPGHPSRDRYHIRPGRGPKGDRPPTGWESVFGGPAWTRLPDGEWYLHIFDESQPDLHWDHPEVRDEFDDILRFWLDRDIDGFRVDVAHGLVKDPEYGEVAESQRLLGSVGVTNHPFWDRDGIHEIVRRWRGVLDTYDPARCMVAEAWVSASRLARFLRVDEYHQAFDFSFLGAGWDKARFKKSITGAIRTAGSVGRAPIWTLSNHDVMRHATRFGLPEGTDHAAWPVTGPHDDLDAELGLRRARAAALLMFALPGAVYLYQGEELGLPEVWDLPVEVLDDPVWTRSGGTAKGRDGCRVPLPWARTGPSLGFGDAAAWLPQPTDWAARSVEAQSGDPSSVLSLYREAMKLRRGLFPPDDTLTWRDAGRSVLAFDRGPVTCVVNFRRRPVALPAGDVELASAAWVTRRG